MFALLSMTNPWWEFIIGPAGLVALGWWLRGRCDDPDPLGPYGPFAPAPEWVDPTEPQIRILGPDREPFDQEKEGTNGI